MKSAKCKVVRRRRAGPRGFSLLEVILAVAILAGAIAVLGELTRQGLECSGIARDTAHALLRCESKINEITSGSLFPSQTVDQPCDEVPDPNRPPWLYSIDVSNTDVQGLIAVRVTVYQLPAETHPAECSLTRWIVDPGVELTVPEDQSQTDSSGTGTTGTAGTTGTSK